MPEPRVPLAVRLPAEQMEWIDSQARTIGGRAAVIRLLLDDAIRNGWTVRVGNDTAERR